MNLIALLAGLIPWAATPVSAFTRIYLACSVLSLEAQAVTWMGHGTLDSLVPLNVTLAAISVAWHVRTGQRTWAWARETVRRLPLSPVMVLLAVVFALNVWRPVEAADPYELDRLRQIEAVGTLSYAPAIDPKANIVGGFYELMLGDLHGVPRAGETLLRFHGIMGLALLCVSFAAVQTWLPVGDSLWAKSLVFAVPVVFQQFVLIKSDLFVAAPAFVALAWVVGTTGRARLSEMWWAGWLAGLVLAAKLTNSAVALAVGVSIVARERTWRSLFVTGAGVIAGAIAAGLALTFWQNSLYYGDPLALEQVEAMGNLNRTVGGALVALLRFVISFFDWTLITRRVWPGRGGWGGTFGLPFVWALVVLVASCRTLPVARKALLAGAFCLLAFGLTFPDADVAHRLAIGPALMMIVAAASAAHSLERPWVTRSMSLVLALSAVQIFRTTLLYLARA